MNVFVVLFKPGNNVLAVFSDKKKALDFALNDLIIENQLRINDLLFSSDYAVSEHLVDA